MVIFLRPLKVGNLIFYERAFGEIFMYVANGFIYICAFVVQINLLF